MKIFSFALVLALTANSCTVAFKVDPGGDFMKNAVEKSLLTKIKPLQDTGSEFPPLRNEILGTEVPCKFEYWDRPDIHTFGNTRLGGAIHAAMAPIATKIIDVRAYGGVDVRKKISKELRSLVSHSRLQYGMKETGARIVDLCCGVGMSTRSLEFAFYDAETLVGVDSSSEMINMAVAISGHEWATRMACRDSKKALKVGLRNTLKVSFKAIYMKLMELLSVIDNNAYPASRTATQASYRVANAERTELPKLSFDLVTVMYAFHEIPMEARGRILNEARRILRRGGQLAIVDISPSYTPAPAMLAGEPFVLEYQQNIDAQLANFKGFHFSKCKSVIPDHVNLWLLTAA